MRSHPEKSKGNSKIDGLSHKHSYTPDGGPSTWTCMSQTDQYMCEASNMNCKVNKTLCALIRWVQRILYTRARNLCSLRQSFIYMHAAPHDGSCPARSGTDSNQLLCRAHTHILWPVNAVNTPVGVDFMKYHVGLDRCNKTTTLFFFFLKRKLNQQSRQIKGEADRCIKEKSTVSRLL